MKKYFTRTWE